MFLVSFPKDGGFIAYKPRVLYHIPWQLLYQVGRLKRHAVSAPQGNVIVSW